MPRFMCAACRQTLQQLFLQLNWHLCSCHPCHWVHAATSAWMSCQQQPKATSSRHAAEPRLSKLGCTLLCLLTCHASPAPAALLSCCCCCYFQSCSCAVF
jgi:hypothetical protein